MPGVSVPYWDWASDSALPDPSTGPVWGTDLMGGNGDPGDGNLVQTGAFAFDSSDPDTWVIVDDSGNPAGGLTRQFGVNDPTLPTQNDVTTTLGVTPYDASPWNATSSSSFRNDLEGWPNGPQMHNQVHVWVGGDMLPMTSPNDPVFFLHHCMVDKLWADWQRQQGGNLVDSYLPASGGPDGHNVNDVLYPWTTDISSVLDHRQFYFYDNDTPLIDLKTPNVVFNDVPESETTVRAVLFEVTTCTPVTLSIISGPGAGFGTMLGTSVTVTPGTETVVAEARIWISFTGTNDGDIASGSVTVRAQETGEEWTIPISANTISRPTVAAVLALDKSNSMNFDSGIPGLKRIDVLHFSAPPFVDLIQEGNALGIVSFDQDAYNVMPVTGPLGPVGAFDPDRANAKALIAAHTPNPMGNTSIGDAVDLAHSNLNPVTGFDVKSTIVLTDGQENQPQFIADVAASINERVYAIGLGTADQINPVALTSLTNGTGGYLLITGPLNTDALFRVSKYYLQILAGVTNQDIVLDPEGWLSPGQKHRIPFSLNEADISTDVILLSQAPWVFQFQLETPAGDVIDPSVAMALPGMRFASSTNVSFYRFTLPVPIGGGGAHAGTWHALLRIDEAHYKRYLASLDNYPDLFHQVKANGARYFLNVHAFSGVRMQTRLDQTGNEPGATMTLRSVLTEYGLPIAGRATARAELERPDGTQATLVMSEVDPGVFETSIVASQSGVYHFRVIASGSTLRGRPFTREELRTGVVWKGGDQPSPTGGGDDGRPGEWVCRLLTCLLSEDVIGKELRAELVRRGLDLDHLKKCVELLCRRQGQGVTSLGIAQPQIREALDVLTRMFQEPTT